MDVREAIRTKRAVRVFADRPVSEEDIQAVLDAGRRAQSSKNTQPWQFVLAQDKAILKGLSESGMYASHIAGASFAVVLVGEGNSNWISFDLGQAAAYMQLAAWDLGIGSCIASFHEPDKAKAVLGLPDELTAWVGLSFGYPASEFRPAKMGGRKALNELVHRDRW